MQPLIENRTLKSGLSQNIRGLSRRALRRRIQRQLRAVLFRHLKREGIVTPETLLTSEIQTASWWSRLILGAVGVSLAVVGGFAILADSASVTILGIVLAAFGAVLAVAAARGRRQTVRAYLERIWDSAKREAEENLDDLVRQCMEKNGILNLDSVPQGVDFRAGLSEWADPMEAINQVGNIGRSPIGVGLGDDVDLGEVAGGIAGGIVDGVFSGL
jgi:hypothetical protein